MPTPFNVSLSHSKKLTTLVCLIFVATGYVSASTNASTNVSGPAGGSSGDNVFERNRPLSPCEDCLYQLEIMSDPWSDNEEITPDNCDLLKDSFDCFPRNNCKSSPDLRTRLINQCSNYKLEPCHVCKSFFEEALDTVVHDNLNPGSFSYCQNFIFPIACVRARNCFFSSPVMKAVRGKAERLCSAKMSSSCGLCYSAVESILFEFEKGNTAKAIGLCGYLNVVLQCLANDACFPLPSKRKERLEKGCAGQSVKFGLAVSGAIGKSGTGATVALLVVAAVLVPRLRV